ncbi:E22 family MetX-like putative esterase [Gallaecimonas mangrovi]|uniref:E22 family MetX-like putative esterase n=1 Tax=Gallaecimonas mangrovi TaxID=2291597 RepID=UPI000E20890E|nr:homoserine O-acetyltransferase [Gallaecimonas mangrovi]
MTKALPWVQKQRFTTANFSLVNGAVLPQVALGWEAYGQLNADKSNAVLITHHFSGNSHAAGRYRQSDAEAGYWDSIIGPGKAIDTDRFYVLSMDSLCNLQPFSPDVVTTGPASINPATAKPYGLDFPVYAIGDLVNVQKALLESLGIGHLHAVAGPSSGAFQALEWAVRYPDWVSRMISVIGAGQLDAWTVCGLERWSDGVKSDPAWQDGHYYDDGQPLAGIARAMASIFYDATYPSSFNRLYAPPSEAAPRQDIRARHQCVDQLLATMTAKAEFVDANSILYLVRASQNFLAGFEGTLAENLEKLRAKTLFLPARHDRLLMPYLARQCYEQLAAADKLTHYQEVDGCWGHLDGIASIASESELIKAFLD